MPGQSLLKNSIVELHDSMIGSIISANGNIVILFSPAYIHSSDGKPGYDYGRVFTCKAELLFSIATTTALPARLPYHISEGTLRVGDAIRPNTIPIPFDSKVKTSLHVLLGSDAGSGEFTTIELEGARACLTLVGEPLYIEDFGVFPA